MFRSATHYRVQDPSFQCFAQVARSTYNQIPKEEPKPGEDRKTKETLLHDSDEFNIQSVVDTLHTGMGCYAPRYLTRKLPYGYHGYAVACLNITDNWQFSDDLIKLTFFNDDCYQVNLADITDPEPELPPEEITPVQLSRADQKRLTLMQGVVEERQAK